MNTLIFAVAVAATNAYVSAEMPTIVVEASRLDATVEEMPQYVEVISRKEITESGAYNLPDLLTRRAGLQVMNPGGRNPAMTQISMRGYGENGFGRTLILLDGEVLNNPDMYAPNLGRVPLSSLERIEILHGPQSVLYGGQASAGMINLVTDTKDYTPRSEVELKVGSWNTLGAHLGTRGGLEEEALAYWAAFDWERSDGYRHHSGYNTYAANAGLRKDFANGAYARLSFFYDNQDYDLAGPLAKAALDHPRQSLYNHDDCAMIAFGLRGEVLGVIDDANSVKLALTASRRRTRYTNGDYTDIYGMQSVYDRNYLSHIYAYTARVQYLNECELGKFYNRFTLGSDLSWETARVHMDDASPLWDMTTSEKLKKDRFTAGLFAEDELFLTDELSLTLGTRLERMWTKNRLRKNLVWGGYPMPSYDRFSDPHNLVAFEAGINYRPVEWAKTFVKWSRFYRVPFVDESTWVAGREVGGPDPEHGWSIDVGGELDYEREYFLGGTLFLSDTSKEIYYNPVLMSNENFAGHVRRMGFEGHVGWEREYLAGLFLRYSAVRAKIADGEFEDNDMPGVASQNLSLDGRVWLWHDCYVFGGYRLLGKRYAISDWANSDKLGTESIFRLGTSYSPSVGFLDGFTFTLSCENLFDREYCDYVVRNGAGTKSAYYPAAGRSLLFTARYEF